MVGAAQVRNTVVGGTDWRAEKKDIETRCLCLFTFALDLLLLPPTMTVKKEQAETSTLIFKLVSALAPFRMSQLNST
jgi:hypothetical protein